MELLQLPQSEPETTIGKAAGQQLRRQGIRIDVERRQVVTGDRRVPVWRRNDFESNVVSGPAEGLGPNEVASRRQFQNVNVSCAVGRARLNAGAWVEVGGPVEHACSVDVAGGVRIEAIDEDVSVRLQLFRPDETSCAAELGDEAAILLCQVTCPAARVKVDRPTKTAANDDRSTSINLDAHAVRRVRV